MDLHEFAMEIRNEIRHYENLYQHSATAAREPAYQTVNRIRDILDELEEEDHPSDRMNWKHGLE